MRGMKIVALSALAVALTAGAALAWGPEHSGHGGGGPAGRGMGILRAIHRVSGLTEQQEDQIDSITMALHKQARAMRRDRSEQRDALRELIKSGASDREITAEVEKKAKERTQMATKHALAMRDIVKVLTDQRREELFAGRDNGPGGPRGGRHGRARQ